MIPYRPLSALASGMAALLPVAFLMIAFTPGPAVPYQISSEASTMTIAGTSTLHDWECDAPGVTGNVRVDASASAEGVPIGDVPAVTVEVPVEQIECGKSRMNRNLRKALDADAYPKIFFSLKTADLTALPDSAGTWFGVDATGELIIAGARRSVDLSVQGERLDDGRLRFVGEKSLKMTDFDVEPPSVMLGTINTGDEVTIRFDVVAERS